MKIEKITVSGLNSALAAIGLSYGDEYDPFKVSTKNSQTRLLAVELVVAKQIFLSEHVLV